MKTSELYAEERRQKIIRYLQIHTRCSVGELATLFETTPVTIRSDLRILEQTGKLTRTHGGAMLKSQVVLENFVHERKNDEVKNKIAFNAISYIKDGDSIALDTGTTAFAFANALIHSDIKNIKIITADFSILSILEKREDFEVIALGGKMRHGFHFSYGDMTLQMLELFRVDKCILTTSALDFEQGLTTPNMDTAMLKAKLVNIAKEVILLCDASKLNKVCFSKICDLEKIDTLIVDDSINPSLFDELKKYIKSVVITS